MASATGGGHSVSGNPVWIGNNQVFGPRYFQGRIDEVAIFNRALTAAEIAALYATAAGFPTLNIAPLNNAVLLAWPTNFGGYALQTNGSLSTTNWATLTTNYSIISTNCAVTNAIGSGQLFYRLQQQVQPAL